MVNWKELSKDVEKPPVMPCLVVSQPVNRLSVSRVSGCGVRAYGRVEDSEKLIAIPADRLERTVRGLKTLKETRLAYPIAHMETGMDVTPLFEQWYTTQDT